MSKNIFLAAAAAVLLATTGLASSADAGFRHGHKGWGHSYKKFSYSYNYRPYAYTYRTYKPAYTYRYYKPVCHKYGWVYKHGHKVWACIW